MSAHERSFSSKLLKLSRLGTEVKSMVGLTTDAQEHYHELSPAVTTNENKAIYQLIQTIRAYTSPFSHGDDSGSNSDLYNLVTKKVVCETAKKDLDEQSEIVKKLFSSFVKDRLKSGTTNLWAVMKKRKIQTWKSSEKKSSQGESRRVCGGAEGGSVSVFASDDGLKRSPRCY